MLTNRRALTTDGLEALGRLGLPWTLDEWTLSGEEELLRNSLVAFVPVNAQPFSIAKSLNRAVSALTAGTQVLSVGYPLYQPLHAFIYRDTSTLLGDIESACLRLRRDTLPALADRFAEWADPRQEATRLATFLDGEIARRATALAVAKPNPGGVAVLHGFRSGVDVHQLAQLHRHMSVSSPFCSENPNYDVRFVGGVDGIAAELEDRSLPRLRPDLAPLLQPATSRNGRAVHSLPLGNLFPGPAATLARAWTGRKSRLAVMASYEPAVAAQMEIMDAMFPGVEVLLSEAEAPYGMGASAFVRKRFPGSAA